MRTVMVAPGATPCGTRTRTSLPSGALTVIDPPAGMLGGILTRMSVEPGCRGGGRGGGGGGGTTEAVPEISRHFKTCKCTFLTSPSVDFGHTGP